MTDNEILSEKAQSLRRRAEEIAGAKAGGMLENIEVLSLEQTRHLLHDLRVHQIELEMQNEELRRTQLDLEDSRARYFDLYELAPVGYITISEKGLVTKANLTIVNMLGVRRSTMLKQPLTRFIFRDDQDTYYQLRRQMVASDTPQVCELRMLRREGGWFWARLETSMMHPEDGEKICRVVISNITDRKQAEEYLQISLDEKVVLLKEIHHRVKNNLASIIDLISLQQETLGDPAMISEFSELAGRIRSMALVHQLLYQSQNLRRIDMQDYFESLLSRLRKAYRLVVPIDLRVAAQGIEMDIDNAIPCGLIVTELVTNAFKYAFPNDGLGLRQQDCHVSVTAGWDGSACTLVVSDNGVGMPEGLDWRETKSLGLQLVVMLGERQLDGKVELEQSEGTTFRLKFMPRGGSVE